MSYEVWGDNPILDGDCKYCDGTGMSSEFEICFECNGTGETEYEPLPDDVM